MTWLKLINSGSGAHLASVTASNGAIVSGSLAISGSISNPDYIDYRIQAIAPTHNPGRLYYQSSSMTLNFDTEVNGYSLELGHVTIIRVSNRTGNTLDKGVVVFITGSQGNRPTVATASYQYNIDSDRTIGIVSNQILDNHIGYVVTHGYIVDINTSAYNEGDILYLSSSGHYTAQKATPPMNNVRLGSVIRSHSTQGTIYVNINNGYQLEELHNVFTSSLSPGDLLQYSESGVWANSKILTGSYQLTGSLNVLGSITSSLLGTSSYSDFSTSASFARSSSNSLQSNISISSSLAQTASYVLNAVSSSFATNSMTASYIATSSWSLRSVSSSYSVTSSFLSDATQSLYNKRFIPRFQKVASTSSMTPNADTDDLVIITAQTGSVTIQNPVGTPVQGQPLLIRLKDNGTARSITFGSQYRGIGLSLPTSSVISKTLYMTSIYNSDDTKWDTIYNQEV